MLSRGSRLAVLAMAAFAFVACDDETTETVVVEGDAGPTCAPGCGACEVCDTSGDAPVCVDLCGEGAECVDGECVGGAPTPTCDPGCAACQRCDTSGGEPACVDICGEGAECVDGVCEASAPPGSCDPECGPCQVCDTSGDAPACVDSCGDGAECVDGLCVPEAAPACDPGCGPCQVCDTSGDEPVCADACGEGLECVEGVCQAPAPATCDPECSGCQICDTSGDEPVCVDACGAAQVCIDGACRRDGPHRAMEALAGDFESGPAVTAKCIECHQEQADHFQQTAHWRWAGATPGVEGHEGDTHVGKRNLINNFCVATISNEPRCTQCHAGYDWRDDNYDLDDQSKMDCLVCHAEPSTYSKEPKTAGNPPEDLDLGLAARSVGMTTVANCGKCHFGAGGGNNVKKGDLGGALARATRETDVHMGIGITCGDCHAGPAHTVLGLMAHSGVTAGRISCTDCHPGGGHESAVLNNHAQDVACQTCHVPAFSRQEPTKMWWDWSTSGDRTRGENGVEGGELDDGTAVTVYDAMKGDFRWEKAVRPSYAWFDGTTMRMTIEDQYPEGAGGEDSPVVLGRPLATIDSQDALIWPFKVMRGRQPGDPARRMVIVPKLFGPGGFWGGIPAADAYSAEAVEALWAAALTAGARAAGQIGAEESYAVGDWSWIETELWMGINHEVAPSNVALGCDDCHNDNPSFDWEALGYGCDPMAGGMNCGSRH